MQTEMNVMYTDRELLELAAKACKIDYIKDCVWIENGFYSPLSHERITWNPLIDDGDCARMEAALGIDVGWHKDYVNFYAPEGHYGFENFEDHANDRQAARRRASVRCAAEIQLEKEQE